MLRTMLIRSPDAILMIRFTAMKTNYDISNRTIVRTSHSGRANTHDWFRFWFTSILMFVFSLHQLVLLLIKLAWDAGLVARFWHASTDRFTQHLDLWDEVAYVFNPHRDSPRIMLTLISTLCYDILHWFVLLYLATLIHRVMMSGTMTSSRRYFLMSQTMHFRRVNCIS